MVYKAIAPEKVISIKCTLAEYNSKEFKENFNVALESDAGKIVIEIINKDRWNSLWDMERFFIFLHYIFYIWFSNLYSKKNLR